MSRVVPPRKVKGFFIMEIWRDIKGYEGLYKVSNKGRVRSLKRKVKCRGGAYRVLKERVLRNGLNSKGYLHVFLYKRHVKKDFSIHQLVAINFLNHTPCGWELVVNHINFDRTDNRVENLEIVTNRENSNQKHLPSSSKYVGVCWSKNAKKWMSRIRINEKVKHIGYFVNEYDAHLAYQKALREVVTNK